MRKGYITRDTIVTKESIFLYLYILYICIFCISTFKIFVFLFYLVRSWWTFWQKSCVSGWLRSTSVNTSKTSPWDFFYIIKIYVNFIRHIIYNLSKIQFLQLAEKRDQDLEDAEEAKKRRKKVGGTTRAWDARLEDQSQFDDLFSLVSLV